MGACFCRSSKLSRESGLGSDDALSTGELAVVSEAGNKAAPVPAGLAADEVIAACAFDTLAVCVLVRKERRRARPESPRMAGIAAGNQPSLSSARRHG